MALLSDEFVARSQPTVDPATRSWNLTVNSTEPLWVYCRQGLGTPNGQFGLLSSTTDPSLIHPLQAIALRA